MTATYTNGLGRPCPDHLVTPPVCPHCGRVIVTGEPRLLIGLGLVVHLACAARAQRSEERAS